MVPSKVGRFSRGMVMFSAFALAAAMAQTVPVSLAIAPNKAASPCSLESAFPMIALDCGHQLEYVGQFSADGRFSTLPLHRRWYNDQKQPEHFVASRKKQTRPAEVPAFVNMRPQERVAENYEGRHRAVKVLQGQSKLAAFRDRLITFAYGHEQPIVAPQHLAMDSRGRLIVTDPVAGAVHVLDGDNSFRIAAGDGRHLRVPAGVAVDANDNIYVADPERGWVDVYDSRGNFLHYIGKLDDESLFIRPTGIAIHRANSRLYLLDTPRNLLVILDLNGSILKRVGQRSTDAVPVEFRTPTEIALSDSEVFVLDANGSRIQVFDLDGTLLRQFNTGTSNGIGVTPLVAEMGLTTDSEGNVYLSNVQRSSVRVFTPEGKLLNNFGVRGDGEAQFDSPTGVWASSSHLYVADTENRRIEVFEIHSRAQEVRQQLAAGDAP